MFKIFTSLLLVFSLGVLAGVWLVNNKRKLRQLSKKAIKKEQELEEDALEVSKKIVKNFEKRVNTNNKSTASRAKAKPIKTKSTAKQYRKRTKPVVKKSTKKITVKKAVAKKPTSRKVKSKTKTVAKRKTSKSSKKS